MLPWKEQGLQLHHDYSNVSACLNKDKLTGNTCHTKCARCNLALWLGYFLRMCKRKEFSCNNLSVRCNVLLPVGWQFLSSQHPFLSYGSSFPVKGYVNKYMTTRTHILNMPQVCTCDRVSKRIFCSCWSSLCNSNTFLLLVNQVWKTIKEDLRRGPSVYIHSRLLVPFTKMKFVSIVLKCRGLDWNLVHMCIC